MEQKIWKLFHIDYMPSGSNIDMKSTEPTMSTVFDSEPESRLHEYKIELEKICDELMKFGLTKNQANR